MPLDPSDVPSRAGIQAALDEVAAQTQSGSITLTPAGSSAPYTATATVNFPVQFATAPYVTLTPWTGSPSKVHVSLSSGPTETTFGLTLQRDDGAVATAIHWIAAL